LVIFWLESSDNGLELRDHRWWEGSNNWENERGDLIVDVIDLRWDFGGDLIKNVGGDLVENFGWDGVEDIRWDPVGSC